MTDLPDARKSDGGRSSSPGAVMRLAAAASNRGRPEEAIQLLDLAALHEPLSIPAEVLRVQNLAQAGRVDEARGAGSRLYGANPARADCARVYYRVLLQYDGLSEALPVLADALRRWPADARFLSALNRLPVDHRTFSELYSLIAERFRRPPPTASSGYLFAQASLQLGQVEAACAALEFAADRLEAAGRLYRALSIWPPERWRERARIPIDASQAVQCVSVPRAQATLVVFPGGWNKFDQLPLAFLDALLSERPLNLIYLQDTKLHGFLKGVPGLGESAETAAVALKQLATQLGAPRLCTMGISFGGFSALRYGALMDANAAMSIVGLTRLQSVLDDDGDAEGVYLKPVLKSYSAQARDVLPDIASTPLMRVTQVVGDGNAQDLWQAKRLTKLPNVTLRVVTGIADHLGVFQELVGRGELEDLLSEWLDPITSHRSS